MSPQIFSAEEFEASLDEAQKWAASVGYKENDVDDIVKSVRKKKGYEKFSGKATPAPAPASTPKYPRTPALCPAR